MDFLRKRYSIKWGISDHQVLTRLEQVIYGKGSCMVKDVDFSSGKAFIAQSNGVAIL